MRKILTNILLMSVASLYGQVAIDKNNVTNNSVSLEFGDNSNKGLILPYVVDKNNITETGTVIYDIEDHKVKYLRDTNAWFDFSIDGTGTADLSIQGNDKTEYPGSKVAITTVANPDSTPDGILVLGDKDKAMILPKVASPHLNIINPAAGMMVYDTANKKMAVYNGKVWTFWGPGQCFTAGIVNSIDCSSSLLPTATEGQTSYSGSFTVSYQGGNGGSYTPQSLSSVPAGFTATLAGGNFNNGSGTVTYMVTSSTVPSAGNYTFNITLGGQNCSKTFTVQGPVTPPGNQAGTGSLSGKTCFDVVEQYVSPECGTLNSRLPQKADFSQTATNTQTYTFRPTSTVSNVRFVYVNTNGQVIQSITPTANYSGNVSTSATATVVYYNNLNALAAGLSRDQALTADIYVVYNDAAGGLGTDRQLKLTVNVQDCVCCGAYVAAGVWKQWMCHNLGAKIDADPFTPSWQLAGGYVQWGRRGPNTTGDSSIDWQTAGNTSNFAAAPTGTGSGQANSGSVSGWFTSASGQPSNRWNSGTEATPVKTVNDPCPTGYRMPTGTELLNLDNYNTLTSVGGTWASTATGGSATEYGKGTMVGTALFFPAVGYRNRVNGGLYQRGTQGVYWTSSTYAGGSLPTTGVFRQNTLNQAGWEASDEFYYATPIRCISEN